MPSAVLLGSHLGWNWTSDEDRQADATAAGKQTHSSHKIAHARINERERTNSRTLSGEGKKGKGKAAALLT